MPTPAEGPGLAPGLNAPEAPAFEASRRLTGANLYFAGPGAVLHAAAPFGPEAVAAWRAGVALGRAALGWPEAPAVARPHAAGVQLALAAPPDQLFTATHLNEWACLAALGRPWAPEPDPGVPALAAIAPQDTQAAVAQLRARAAAEARPLLRQRLAEARARGVPVVLDDDTLSLGLGRRAWHVPLADLATAGEPPWAEVAPVPVALVTGTNGKTTSVRLLAAIAREAGLVAGCNSTEGVVLGGVRVEDGDCAGPDGARRVLRAPVDVAVVEAARGGLLRRGLALARADVALVTNVGADHLGEYGIDDVAAMAEVKLTLARAVDGSGGAPGTLVLCADDALLRRHGPAAAGAARIAWFALDDEHPLLQAHRACGGATAGLRADGHLWLADPAAGLQADLGEAAALPLTAGGHARYNIANLLGAALAAHALGLPLPALVRSLAQFGRDRADNAGRLAHWVLPGPVQVFVDFAHNPDGLAGLLAVARGLAGAQAPLRLLLGQAGNRTPAEVAELAATAMRFAPAQVIVKALPEYARGRDPAEVVGWLREALLTRGLPAEHLAEAPGELEAARAALDAAQPGDVLVLPLHGKAAREAVSDWLDAASRR